MLEDSELVHRVRQGDKDAYGQLAARYERLVRIVALRVLKDHHLAEDVAQESLVVGYRRLHWLRDGAKFGPWLARITRWPLPVPSSALTVASPPPGTGALYRTAAQAAWPSSSSSARASRRSAVSNPSVNQS